ncbi:MAG: P-II family nitrogen regulator [Gammaproteobacteria bacterium]|nr:P-II family nitrogen regulator [Gammaproteobacteria bacterium]
MNTEPHKLITAVVPTGKAMPVLKRLKEEKGIITANVHRARGVGKLTLGARRGFGEELEKSVLTVVVPANIAEEIFEFIFFEADINQPHGGIVFLSRLHAATAFSLPDVPEES